MAHQLVRTISTRWDPASVFTYLLDFENAEEWDAGTVSCRRTSGDGGVGTHYRNVSEFRGNETELDYVVESVEPGRRFVITGTNKTVTSKDTVTVRPTDAGSEVEYRAEMTFKGLAALRLALPQQAAAEARRRHRGPAREHAWSEGPGRPPGDLAALAAPRPAARRPAGARCRARGCRRRRRARGVRGGPGASGAGPASCAPRGWPRRCVRPSRRTTGGSRSATAIRAPWSRDWPATSVRARCTCPRSRSPTARRRDAAVAEALARGRRRVGRDREPLRGHAGPGPQGRRLAVPGVHAVLPCLARARLAGAGRRARGPQPRRGRRRQGRRRDARQGAARRPGRPARGG